MAVWPCQPALARPFSRRFSGPVVDRTVWFDLSGGREEAVSEGFYHLLHRMRTASGHRIPKKIGRNLLSFAPYQKSASARGSSWRLTPVAPPVTASVRAVSLLFKGFPS